MAKELMFVQVQSNMSPPAYIQTLAYYGRWYYDTGWSNLLRYKKLYVRVGPDINKTKYAAQKIVEIQAESPPKVVKKNQDLQAIIELGGPFERIGGDNENVGGNNQKVG